MEACLLDILQFHFWGLVQGLPRWCCGKESTCQCCRHKRCRFNPCVRKISWKGKRKPTAVFLPGKSHGQRCLVGYNPWDHKESGHGWTHTHTHTHHHHHPHQWIALGWVAVFTKYKQGAERFLIDKWQWEDAPSCKSQGAAVANSKVKGRES